MSAPHSQSNLREYSAAVFEGNLSALYILQAKRNTGGEIIDFTFLDVNSRGAELLEMPREAIVQQDLCELLPINRSGGFFEKYKRAVETQTPFEEEFPIDAPGIHAMWLHHRVHPWKDGVAICTRDISPEKLANEEMQKLRDFLNAVIENLPVALFAKEAKNLSFSLWNKTSEAMFGLSRADILGKTDHDFFPKDQADFFVLKDRQTLAGRKMVEIPEEPIDSPGGKRFLYTRKVPILDASGQPIHLLGISLDITDQKRIEEERQRRLQFEAIVSSLSRRFVEARSDNMDSEIHHSLAEIGRYLKLDYASLLLLGHHGRFLTATHGWCANSMTSFGPLECALATDRLISIIEKIHRLELFMFNSLDDLPKELAAERAELTALNIHSALVLPIARAGTLIGALSLSHSQPAEPWLAADLAQLQVAGELFLTALERKQAEDDLRRAKELAESATKTKSMFLASMSHEIRTPLNGIIGMAQLIDASKLDEEQQEYVGMLRSSARSLLRIINDILDFSKIEAGKMTIEWIEFRPREVLEEVYRLFRTAAEENNVVLKLDMGDDISASMVGDPLRVRQVLVNLLSNAVKFASGGNVTLSAVRIRHDQRDYLRVSVRDSGIGIPFEQQRTIFDSFTQADGSTTRRFGGTGLGLAISKQLVQLMGGAIGLASQPGQGSTFWIELPLLTREQGSLANVDRGESDSASPAIFAHDGRLKVLLVDDNAINRSVGSGFLANCGCDVAVATDGLEAIEMARGKEYQLILMDLQMPNIDGFETAKRIRSELHAPPPIIAMSALTQPDDRRRAAEAGMVDFIAKPVTLEVLRKTLAKWFGKSGESRPDFLSSPAD